MNNKDTTDFILDWEYGFDRLDEKLNDDIINFYDEGVFSYGTFADIWQEYASFYRDCEAYFE